MIECGALSERMPEVARGLDHWSAEEQQHLLSCTECAAEWSMVEQGMSLGSYAPANLGLMEQQLLARLRSEPVSRTIPFPKRAWQWGVPILLAAAASVALIIGVPHRSNPAASGDDELVADTTLFPELMQMNGPQLEAVLKSWEDGASQEWVGPTPRLGDLSEEQLKVLLTEVEGGT